MPSLGADMETGTLLEWRVAPGDVVHRGDIVALVDTDKAEIEVEIFCDGVIEALLVEPGRKVPVGTLLARLREPAADPAQPAALLAGSVTPTHPAEPIAAPVRSALPAPAPPPLLAPIPLAPTSAPPTPLASTSPAPTPLAPTSPPPPTRARGRASPLARRVAAELGVDLATLIGSGEGGAISREDVERAAAARAPAPSVAPAPGIAPPIAPGPPGGPDRSAAMRRAIAAAMSRSKREIPHYYLATRVDLTAALRWLGAENARRPVTERLLPAALLLRAVALALRETPELNGHWIDGAFRPSEAVHIGVAIALRQGGLIAPALHDADRKPLPQLMTELRDLVARARAGSLRSSELSDTTITLTNLGELGVEMVFGVIHPPQVAIVGFGRVREEPWAADGVLGVRPVIGLTLAADHRVSDGHRGGRFLTAIDRRLQSPETL